MHHAFRSSTDPAHRAHAESGCCGPAARFGHWERHFYSDDPGAFGVRRPLRFLAHRLGLEEPQIVELARILNDLKTERAQAAVDDRRSLTAFADALGAEAFDAARATEAARLRSESARRLQDSVVRALEQIHALLNADQRGRLAYLIRTGALAL